MTKCTGTIMQEKQMQQKLKKRYVAQNVITTFNLSQNPIKI